jgi:outer membrane lipoprotein-sorting protein
MARSSTSATVGAGARRNRARWLVPVAVTGAVLGGPAAAALVPAGATESLPPLTAAELLAKVQTAKVAGFSGTVTASTDLGLPKLPTGMAGSAGALGLLGGDHSVRVWSAGPDQARIALLDTFAETEVVRSGSDMWAYDSTKNTATHFRLPDRAALAAQHAGADGKDDGEDTRSAGGKDESDEGSGTGLESLTPADAAAKVLAAIDPSTSVSVGDVATVAGRSAYELRVAPRSSTSLVDTVVVAVDAESGLPLRVAVTPRGHTTPAVDVRFTQVSLDKPAAARFQFSPPKGATVQERSMGTGADATAKPAAPNEGDTATAASGRPEMVGTGWDSVTVAHGVNLAAVTGAAPQAQGDSAAAGTLPSLAGALTQGAKPVTGAFGTGKLLTTSLLTALITDDGRVYAGAVTPEALLAVAAAHS